MSEAGKRYVIGAAEMAAPELASGLYLVATPIGNLRDVTLRALDVLAAADVIYCEDTRVTAKLLERYGIRNHLRPCHDHSEGELAPRIADDVAAGQAIAFASDAGTPLLSDPGYRLVAACVARGQPVFALPGASALLPALQLSGLASDAFRFVGFLPQKRAERRTRLQGLSTARETIIAYESPHRIVEALEDVAAVFGERPVAVARELTKLHEEVLRGKAREVGAELATRDAVKGECVIVIAGLSDEASALDEAAVARILADAAAALPPSKAAAQAAKLTGLSREEAFRRILALKDGA